MINLDSKLVRLKMELEEMWTLVITQLETARDALLHNDKDAAEEVVYKERIVDSFELKLDQECESVFAHNNPIATDLRFTLAVLKINSNLERVADFARAIASTVLKSKTDGINPDLIAKAQVEDLLNYTIEMLVDAKKALEYENSRMAVSIIARDEMIDEISRKANSIIGDYITKHPNEIDDSLNMHSTLRRIERIGDHIVNIAEEIVFYLEAKVLKHKKKKFSKE